DLVLDAGPLRIPEDLRPPDARQLRVELVQEPVAEAEPGGVARGAVAAAGRQPRDRPLPGLIRLDDLRELVGPVARADPGEQRAPVPPVAGVPQAGEAGDVDVAAEVELL